MGKPVILSACRTAGGKFGGALKGLDASALGAVALRAAVSRSGIDPKDLGEDVMGNGWQSGVAAFTYTLPSEASSVKIVISNDSGEELCSVSGSAQVAPCA